jgi:antitoxin ParD1/3/4
MHIRFAEVDEQFIKSQVESGFYTNETELVRDAVRRMREAEERKAQFLAAVRLGVAQAERGETVSYSDELMEAISQRAAARAIADKPIKNTEAMPRSRELEQ